MALSYGLTNPAAFMKGEGSEVTPDLVKFYTAVPTRSTQSTAANKRRPVLYTSFSGGFGWKYESETSSSTTHGFYDANYCGNFYFDANNADADHGVLMALAHKSASSSYGAYKARAGLTYPIRIANQSWEWSSVVAYNTTNQPNREICKCPGSNRYFCIKEGGGYAYNNTAWSTANWTTTSFGLSSITLSDDGGFKHICVDPEKDHDALVFFTTNDSNKYLRFYLCNLNDLNAPVDYTTTIFYAPTRKQSEYKYVSIDFLPGVGYLIFYCYGSDNNWCVKRLLTHDLTTGELLPFNQYILAESIVKVGTFPITQNGSHGWYCPWTKEYYFVPSARQVFWTKDGLNWNSSAVTGASTSAVCRKFITDGQNMIVATSGSAYYRSYDKGQSWVSGTSLSPDGFNVNRSNDTIVMPFRCINNIGIDMSSVVLGEYYTSTGTIGTSVHNFRLNDYIPVDPSTSYVFFGKKTTDVPITRNSRISFYDSNKTFISQTESNSWITTGSGNYTPCIVTSPSNAAYARLCCRIDDNAVTQESIASCKWYFAKENDFIAMTNYGNIVCD